MEHRLIRASQRLSDVRISITLDGYTIEVYWFRVMNKEGDWFIKRHAHSTYEFHVCALGSCTVDTDTGTFPLRDGYFYLSAPGSYHAQRPANRDEFIEYSLNCSIRKTGPSLLPVGKELERVFSVFTTSPCFPVWDQFGIRALFNQALDEAEQRALGYEWTLHSLIPRILVAAARAIEHDQKTSLSAQSVSPAEPNYRMARIEE
jgi:hypothetical protein